MDYTHYLFAFFVFALVVAVIFLYDRMRRARMEHEETIRSKETRLFQLYQNLEEMVDSMEEFTEQAKDEVKEEKKSIAAMLAKAERIAQEIELKSAPSIVPAPPAEPEPAPAKAPPKQRKPKTAAVKKNISKTEMVQQLNSQGMTDEQISQELGISRGEVTLILGLYKK